MTTRRGFLTAVAGIPLAMANVHREERDRGATDPEVVSGGVRINIDARGIYPEDVVKQIRRHLRSESRILDGWQR